MRALAEFARAAGGSQELCARIAAANTAAEAFALAQSERIALGDEVARAAQRTAERVVEGRDIAIEIVRVRPRWQVLVGRAPFAVRSRRASRESGGDSRDRRARCRENPPRASARPTRMSAVRSIRSAATFAAMSASVPRKMRSSGQLARTTTAAGQSAP